jgi:hypothetical protein
MTWIRCFWYKKGAGESKIDKLKNNKNSYHKNIDFYNMTPMRHRHFGSSMNKNGRLKFISPAKNHRLVGHIFSLLRALPNMRMCSISIFTKKCFRLISLLYRMRITVLSSLTSLLQFSSSISTFRSSL